MITDSKIKNLLKNPESGGIPAIANNTNVKLITKTKFRKPNEVQFAK
jgi:hypothetical protein